ncbi:hypothetical protein GH714_013883 [Hevea brasiliensis]|uniref:DNA repair protein RAD51 homolog 3 n=1 Tax=Hevea brasiliensis TaxID=3981 RepID=A0A6A6LGD4_HEVBR|nr:hypothetical protein GH714_013883 [Hevea brasiliensis]
MEVCRLPLSATQRGNSYQQAILLSLPFLLPPLQISRDLKISDGEALEILNVASRSSRSDNAEGSHAIINGAQNAWDMLHEESSLTRITTSSADLDNILGGGISCKEVTEIGGVPGIGKTQLGIQLAVNVQIPPHCGGLGGRAIYIDTEGSFMVERALQVAEACIETCQNIVGSFIESGNNKAHRRLLPIRSCTRANTLLFRYTD